MTTLKDLLHDLVVETQEQILKKTDSAVVEHIIILDEEEIEILINELLNTFVDRYLGVDVWTTNLPPMN